MEVATCKRHYHQSNLQMERDPEVLVGRRLATAAESTGLSIATLLGSAQDVEMHSVTTLGSTGPIPLALLSISMAMIPMSGARNGSTKVRFPNASRADACDESL